MKTNTKKQLISLQGKTRKKVKTRTSGHCVSVLAWQARGPSRTAGGVRLTEIENRKFKLEHFYQSSVLHTCCMYPPLLNLNVSSVGCRSVVIPFVPALDSVPLRKVVNTHTRARARARVACSRDNTRDNIAEDFLVCFRMHLSFAQR